MTRSLLIALTLLWSSITQSQDFTPDDLASRTIHRRAVEAAIWGMPAVNYQLMYQEMVRKTKGSFNQVVFWPRLLDWKNQTRPRR
jgi:hypothetical protein